MFTAIVLRRNKTDKDCNTRFDAKARSGIKAKGETTGHEFKG